VEEVPTLEATNRVLARAQRSTMDVPPMDNSAMDGYAIRLSDLRQKSSLIVKQRIMAGSVGKPLEPGTAARIFTGAPIPPGADAVAPQEDVRREGGAVLVARPVLAGSFVRPRGEDIRAGERVLGPGALLGPAALGVLAALGRPLVRVHQRPRVAILSTGDELVDVDVVPGPGQIPNSNTYTLSAQVREAGGVPVNLGIARDSREDLEEHFRWGLAADMLVSSAGVSVGDRDFVREVMEKLGAELDFWKVSMRPGKPLTFGRVGGRPFFGLPGNPVSSMVTFELFVRPALRRMAGDPRLFRPRATAHLAAPLDNPGPRRGYLRVRLAEEGGRLIARATGEQGSGILKSMLLADGLAVVPPDTRVQAGQPIEVILLRSEVAPTPDAG